LFPTTVALKSLRRRNVEQTKSKWFQMFLWNPQSNPWKKFQANKNFINEWFQMFLWNPRSNPWKKFQANKNLINAAIYFCEFLELIRIRNVSKQRQTIFLPNARSD
jgi:hypothetical protein